MFKKISANIYFLTEFEGGRKEDIPKTIAYYRPLLCYKMNNYHCQLELENVESLCLGNTYKLQLDIIDICPIKEGEEFELKEKSVVARGKIIKQLM